RGWTRAVDRNVNTDHKRITVASLLAGKLREEIVDRAKPLDERCQLSLSLSLEPWIEFSESGRKVEVHIRERGEVELRVFVAGRKRNPHELRLNCKDGDLDAFTDYLAANFDALVARLSGSLGESQGVADKLNISR
ncbi:MAG TPA: hypothetical protein VLB07_08300, partial [Woeseiaceae bacterium]|nr:hypothetical protein [Woeseiaceae bacterium]